MRLPRPATGVPKGTQVEGSVGIVGIGAMGSAIARRLLDGGFDVVGTDIRDEHVAFLERHGGRGVSSARQVAEETDQLILSMPSAEAFLATTLGAGGIVEAGRSEVIAMDTSTLDVADKETARRGLEEVGTILLDCTLSGTPPMCLDDQMTLYASGDEVAYERVADVFRAFTRDHTFMGGFGNASRIKYVINYLVCINNAASAEALAYAAKLGLDPATVYDLVADSFASSRVWERRAKLMVEGDYTSSRNTYNIGRKDARVIGAQGSRNATPMPIFSAALQMHHSGIGQGLYDLDPASLYEVYRRAAGLPSMLDQHDGDGAGPTA